MDISDVHKSNNEESFVLTKATPAYVNALRRSVISLVPTLAVETVEVVKNTSALYDEVLAHRLGLLPLTTDLKSYKLPSDFPDDGVHRPECEVKLTLEAKGPCVVYAEELKSKDPSVKCAIPKMPVVKLLDGQEILLNITAVLGQGVNHMKWSAGGCFYQKRPVVVDGSKKTPVSPKNLTNNKVKEVLAGGVNTDIKASDKATVETKDDEFIVTVEPWGQLGAKEMVSEALTQLNKQLDAVNDALKNLK